MIENPADGLRPSSSALTAIFESVESEAVSEDLGVDEFIRKFLYQFLSQQSIPVFLLMNQWHSRQLKAANSDCIANLKLRLLIEQKQH